MTSRSYCNWDSVWSAAGSRPSAIAPIPRQRASRFDEWMTLATVMIFGGFSLFGVSSALLKYSQALAMMGHSQNAVPAHLTQQALRQLL
jgi:hypothetical protein